MKTAEAATDGSALGHGKMPWKEEEVVVDNSNRLQSPEPKRHTVVRIVAGYLAFVVGCYCIGVALLVVVEYNLVCIVGNFGMDRSSAAEAVVVVVVAVADYAASLDNYTGTAEPYFDPYCFEEVFDTLVEGWEGRSS